MNMKPQYLFLLPVVLLTSSLITSCGWGGAGADEKRIVMLAVTQQCDYCSDVQQRIEEQFTAAGYHVSTKLTDFDAAEQAQQVNQAISEQPEAIVLWPADSTAAVAPIRKIKAAGIPVIAVDSQPTGEAAQAALTSFTGPDNYLMGSQAAVAMVQGITEKNQPLTGQVAVIAGVPGTEPAIKRMDGFAAKLAEIAPDLEISTVVSSDSWDQSGAAGVAASIVNRIPPEQLRGVFGHYDTFISAFIVAAKQAGLDPGRFVAVGVVCTPDGARNIENGDQYATILQSPDDQATYAVDAALQAVSGRAPAKTHYMPAQIITKTNASMCAG